MSDLLYCLQIKAEAMRVNKLREQTAKKIKQLEDQRAEVEGERDALKLEISSLEHDLESKTRETDAEKKKLEELLRERDILTKLRSQVTSGLGGMGGKGGGRPKYRCVRHYLVGPGVGLY